MKSTDDDAYDLPKGIFFVIFVWFFLSDVDESQS